jgi:hypothetical protein
MFRSLVLSLFLLPAGAAWGQEIFGLSTYVPIGPPPTMADVVRAAVPGAALPPRLMTVPLSLRLVAFDPAGDRMYLAGGAGDLHAADLRAGTLRDVPFDASGATFAFDDVTGRLIASRAGQIVAVDGERGTATPLMTLPADLALMAVDGARQRAYLTERGDSHSFFMADLVQRTMSDSISSLTAPAFAVVDSDGAVVLLNAGPNYSIGTVVRIDPLTRARTTIRESLPVRLAQPGFDRVRHLAYLTVFTGFGVSDVDAFDVRSGALEQRFSIAGDSVDLAVGSPLTPPRRRAVRH